MRNHKVINEIVQVEALSGDPENGSSHESAESQKGHGILQVMEIGGSSLCF